MDGMSMHRPTEELKLRACFTVYQFLGQKYFFHTTQPSVCFKIGGGGHKMQGKQRPKNFREMPGEQPLTTDWNRLIFPHFIF